MCLFYFLWNIFMGWFVANINIIFFCWFLKILHTFWKEFITSIDETIRLIKGHLGMAHWWKMKPIREGCKFLAFCDTQTSFCYTTFPNGFRENSNKIWTKVVYLLHFLPDREHKIYVTVIANYFIQVHIGVELEWCGVVIFGTIFPETLPKDICLRAKEEEKKIILQDCFFNTICYQDHSGGFHCFCWLNNYTVKMVSNVHTGNLDESLMRARKKPMVNQRNCACCKHQIMGIITNYNYWMLGCELCNQLITYYWSDIPCHQTCMLLMFHYLGVLCVNLYVLYE